MSTLSVTTITGANTIKSGTASTPPVFQDSNGTEMGELCRAWVNFNGTGTVAIRASFNVTSITDGGTGLYTVNFTNALTDANYAAVCNTNETGSDTSTRSGYATIYSYATGSAVIRCANSANGTAADQAYVSFSVFR